MTTMTTDSEAAIRIAALSSEIQRLDWELATALAAFTPAEYAQALPDIVSETGWSRQRLAVLRMDGKKGAGQVLREPDGYRVTDLAAATIAAIADIVDDPNVADAAVRSRVVDILEIWRTAT